MRAVGFHPSNGYTIAELNENLEDIPHEVEVEAARIGGDKVNFSLLDKIESGRLRVQQGVIAGLFGRQITIPSSRHPRAQGRQYRLRRVLRRSIPQPPVAPSLRAAATSTTFMEAGAIVRTAFIPCFGAGDTPANNGLSIRHTTRNFPQPRGLQARKRPALGKVALADARSIAATAAAGGILTPATDLPDETWTRLASTPSTARPTTSVYWGFGKAKPESELVEVA